jgi:outer membrane protein OmpA-like peptidoglycan-associated protein
MARPMLGDLELEQVQVVQADEDQLVTRHPVPGLEGDFWQVLGRRGTQFSLTGILTAPDTVEHLGELRSRFHAGDPVSFVSDISTATLVDQVLIERMEVRELAGRPSAFEYAFVLREFLEATPVDTEEVDIPPPEPPDVETGKLSVTVVVEGEPGFDMDRVKVTAHGTEDASGAEVTRVLTNKTADNVWFEDPFPAGAFTVEALVDDTATPTGQREVLTGSATARVQNGPVTSVTIVLRRGAKIGTIHTIHFHFDKAFVEPCMRHVLQQVVRYAGDHPDERLLIVGHTDLVGISAYNQALSERRGRATHAMLTFAADPQAAIREWNELRRARPAGTITTVNDTWGTREIQHMLQDLGLYAGNVGVQAGEDASLTDAAIRQFQRDHGLAEDGIVGDDTWPVLIEAYVGREPIDIPADQFMPNANAQGCDEGPLRWLGCSEQDPVRNFEPAWRPNRRTELIFVRESEMPCKVPDPVTLKLVPDGAGGGGWCLNDGTATSVDCFVVPHDQPCPSGPSKAWCRKPAEPGSFVVKGMITFEDGTPFASGKYVLAAPDGEYMDGEVGTTSSVAHAGTPIQGRTQPDGSFNYDTQKGPGTFAIEVDGPFLARVRGEPLTDAKGNAVCFRLDGSKDADIVIVDRAVASIHPSITGPNAVVVRKPHTNPARQAVVLQASTAFTGTATFSRSSDRIKFFDAVAGGNEITFNGTDNVFTDAQLATGHTVFAEGSTASAAVDDVTLTLALTVNGTPGLSVTKTMTSVELFLDIGLSRPAAGVEPPLLPEASKNAPGRAVQMADPLFTHERALVVVGPVAPAGFAGNLSLAPLGGRLTLWNDEVPAAGQVPRGLPQVVATGAIPAAGLRMFVDGTAISAAPADTGLQLGLDGVDPDGDHVRITVVQVELARTAAAAAPAVTLARLGVWDQAYDAASNVRNGEAEAANFVGSDARRLHFRVRDAARTTGEADVRWRTLKVDRTDDDAPPSQLLSLPETAAGSRVFVSRGVMLVSDNTDRDQQTHSGLAAPHIDAGLRARGQSNHRLRRAALDGSLRGEYDAQPGVRLPIEVAVFPRNPDERRRLPVRVIRYTNAADPRYVPATAAFIAAEFARANDRWRQVGLLIEPAATVDRVAPAGCLDPVTGLYTGAANNPREQAALIDLLPITPDGTLTVVFVHRAVGDNANATVADRVPVPIPPGPPQGLGQRYLIFAGTTNPLDDDTIAHELHHVLFNRFDAAVDRHFFAFNSPPPTTDPRNVGIVLPDPRVDRRIQNLNAPDPDVDPANNNILNWVRRARAARQPALVGTGAADATTGNNLVQAF